MTKQARMRHNTSHDNHYVPQGLLRRWSVDGSTVFARRLLASHPNVPEWQRLGIRGLAYQRDLYTSWAGREEVDEFERWVAKEFEQPGLEAVDKMVRGLPLKRDDWNHLSNLFALQDLRTPASFLEQLRRWERDLPEILDKTMRRGIAELTALQATGQLPEPAAVDAQPRGLGKSLRISIHRPQGPRQGAEVRAEVTLGREFWLEAMRHVLTGAARVLREHRWTIVEPGDDGEWPLSDHPALKLNYRSPSDFTFGGGWGVRRTDLLMPLSPRHLLFTEVGADAGRSTRFSYEHTWMTRRFLVLRAHRWLYASHRNEWMALLRPRTVDATAFTREARMWDAWHGEQSHAELQLGT